MLPHQKKNEILQTQKLNKLASPEEMAQSLREFYADPLKELLRRKAVAKKEGNYKNAQFWKAVEVVLFPAEKDHKPVESSLATNDY